MAESTKVGTARVDLVVDTSGWEVGINRAKETQSTFVKGANAEYDALSKREKQRVNNLMRQVQTLGLSRDAQLAYDIQMKSSGKIQDELITRLKSTQNAVKQTTKEFNQYGLTAKQTTAAMRGVPAQITDIFVSLQGGSNPMTVLLQQGGQLKDMFGGIVPAVKALTTSLLGLINPYTVIAAATAGLVIAWDRGQNEAREFNKALIETGDISGKTSDSLAMLAENLGKMSGSSVSSAASTIAEVARSGAFVADQIDTVAKAAEQMRVATGKSVADTVVEFRQLADDPVKAILKLNETQHFLTVEIYEQVKALQEQGQEQQAATVAMNAYADAISSRTGDIRDNLGFLEKAWKNVGAGAKWAWDQMLDIGRADTVVEQIQDLQEKIAGLQSDDPLSYLQLSPADRAKRIADYRAQIRGLRDGMLKAEREARVAQYTQQAQEEAIAIDQQALQYKGNEDKRQAELLKARGTANEAIRKATAVGNKKLAEDIAADLAAIEAGINKKYDDKRPKARAAGVDPGIAILGRLTDQVRMNEEVTKSQERLTASETLYLRTQNDLAEVGKKISPELRKQIDLKLEQVAATGKAAEATLAEAKAKEQLARLDAQLNVERQNAMMQADAELATIGRGGAEVDRMQRRIKIEQDYAKEVARLRDQGIAETDASYIQQEQRLREHRDEMLVIEKGYQDRLAAEQANWRNGAIAASEDLIQQAADNAGAMRNIVTDSFNAMSDAVVQFAKTGKLSLEDFADYAIDTAVRLATNKLLSYILQAFVPGAAAGTAGNPMGGQAYMGSGSLPGYRDGGVFNSPSLSAYSNQVHHSPKTFKFAKGGFGEFAEAGPEAIMPLARDSAGRLGVKSQGGSGNVYIEIVNQGGTKSEVAEDREGPDGSRIVKIITDQAVARVNSEIATMGGVGKTMAARFGLTPQGNPRG
jgi:lambda family phage tail tape measure protein